jgi:uncharacterized protein YbjT (DUF2867 family)
MTIAQQLKATAKALKAWASGNNGVVSIAGDLEGMLTVLREVPGAVRVVVMFHREEKRGDYEERGAVDRYFWVALARGKGLKIETGANLVEGTAGGAPLFDLVDEARQVIRGLSFDSDTTEVTPDYKGADPLTVNGLTLTDVQRLEFSIGTQLPAVDQSNPTGGNTDEG